MVYGLAGEFKKLFGTDAGWFFFAPGRVNIIGEHIDYSGGLVLPCAINMGTYAAIKKSSTDEIVFASKNADNIVKTSLSRLTPIASDGWANYPKMVTECLQKTGFCLTGFDMYFSGDLPNGAGLSSSASLCAVTAFSLSVLFGLPLTHRELASICQKAENLCGVNCGLMDPFAALAGKKNHAVLLNCGTGEHTQVPLNLGDYRIVIANTNKQRSLQGSEYNKRRTECEAALHDLKKVCDVNNLCDLSPKEFLEHRAAVKDETARKRAEHAVMENERVKSACEFASKGSWSEFAALMGESHESLRDLYDVSCKELDSLVKHANDFGKMANPLYGARMTGAGFGGCTINIVHSEDVDAFKKYVGLKYTNDTELRADFYEAVPEDGARKINFRRAR